MCKDCLNVKSNNVIMLSLTANLNSEFYPQEINDFCVIFDELLVLSVVFRAVSMVLRCWLHKEGGQLFVSVCGYLLTTYKIYVACYSHCKNWLHINVLTQFDA